VQANVEDELVIKNCFKILKARWEDTVVSISARNWELLKLTLANL
jgi:hypothetical protein